MDDLRTDPELLADQLLGNDWSGPGLIRRVRAKVQKLSHDPGPTYRTGSIIGSKDTGHEDEGADDGDTPRVLELAVNLIEWRGPGIGHASEFVKRTLIDYLRRHRITDSELLLGGPKVGEGKLSDTATDVRRLLDSEYRSSKAVTRCAALESHLRGWLGEGCRHRFEPMIGEGLDVVVMRCSCGVLYGVRRGKEDWLPV